VEETALKLVGEDPALMKRYLTDYSVGQAEMVVERWQDLAGHLITKYNDGYVKDEDGRPQDAGYPEEWLREVVRSRGDHFRLKPGDASPRDWELID
jgi:hypothetical protein